MTNKEINFRSILFLGIGILLLLSLIVCVYIEVEEKDLVKIEATIIKLKEDSDGTGKNDITALYEVNGVSYNYNFYYKDNYKVGEKNQITRVLLDDGLQYYEATDGEEGMTYYVDIKFNKPDGVDIFKE